MCARLPALLALTERRPGRWVGTINLKREDRSPSVFPCPYIIPRFYHREQMEIINSLLGTMKTACWASD